MTALLSQGVWAPGDGGGGESDQWPDTDAANQRIPHLEHRGRSEYGRLSVVAPDALKRVDDLALRGISSCEID
jgi:hypothetical protein